MMTIKFNSEMIDAILIGRKVQTRRPIYDKTQFLQVGQKVQVLDGKGRPVFITGDKIGEIRIFKNAIINTLFPSKSRPLTITITGRRTEPLQIITREDAKKEGLARSPRVVGNRAILCYKDYLGGAPKPNPINSFKSLWIKIYGSSSWGANEQIVVYNFEITKD